MPLVSVVIPTHNRHELLSRCLESLRRQTLTDLEVIVVDNGSQPPVTTDALASLPGRVIRFEQNTGFCYAVNQGLRVAAGAFVLLLNNDVELEPRFLEQLTRALEREPAAGFATGKLLRAREPGVIDGAGDALLLGGGAYRLGHGERDSGQWDTAGWTFGACGAAALYRRGSLDEIGVLDEDFYAYLEDMDLALRAQRAGYRGLYMPQAIAQHHGSATLGPDDRRILTLITRNQLFLIWKNFPVSLWFRCGWRIAVFQTLWALHLVRRGFAGAYVRGLAQAFLALPRVLAGRRSRRSLRRIKTGEFLDLLRESERAIYESEQRRKLHERSHLLAWYFALCGKPTTGGSAVRSVAPQPGKEIVK